MTKQLSDTPPLIVVVGVTASGKSALAMDLAKRYNGEIICADSRTIYQGMDIGTAKPSIQDRVSVSHHLLDVVKPDEFFSAAEFKRLANQAIADISARGKLPIMVGGSGLYIDGVIFDFAFLPPVSSVERQELEAMTVEQLHQKLIAMGVGLPENHQNPRHLIRKIETNGAVPVKKSMRENTLVIGLDIERDIVKERITSRVEQMIKDGFVGEVKRLCASYDNNAPGMLAPGYKAFRRYCDGEINIEQAKTEFIRADFQLARRQRTWFKRNQNINWINKASEADVIVKYFLQQK